MRFKRFWRPLAAVLIMVAPVLYFVLRAETKPRHAARSSVPTAATSDAPDLANDNFGEERTHRDLVQVSAPDPESSSAGKPKANTLAAWHGRPNW